MVVESSAINLMILFLKVVTDIIHNVVIIFQATILLVTILVLARVFQPLPCFAVSLFSGSWQFLLLLMIGYWNCISFIQLCIILQWTFILEWEGKKILAFRSIYAFLFAAIGLASDVLLVCFKNALVI